MSETKTPRTDANSRTVQHTSYFMGAALSAKIEVVDADVARRLETELNEAKEAIVKLENACDTCKLYRELNEARAEVERLKAKVDAEINENLQHLADLRGYEEFEIPAKDQLIEKLAGAINDAVSNGGMNDYNDRILKEALQAYEEAKNGRS